MPVTRQKKDAEQVDELIRRLGAGATDVESQSLSESESPAAEDLETESSGVLAEQVSAPTPIPLGDDLETWKQRYKTLQGMHSAAVQQKESLEQLIANIQAAPRETPRETVTEESFISSADIDTFGNDLVDMARRAAKEEFKSLVSGINKQLSDINAKIGSLSKVANTVAENSFTSQLDRLTKSSWRQIDDDPLFIEWLNQKRSRAKAFKLAVSSGDAEETADFFQEFSTLQDQRVEQTSEKSATKQTALENQIAPGRKTTPSNFSDVPKEKKIWKRTEIAMAYGNKRTVSAEEFAKLEKDIFAAQREGRVDYTK